MLKKIATAALVAMIGLAGLSLTQVARADTTVTSSNSCDDCKGETGESNTTNSSAGFVGQNATGNGIGVNAQEGDNELDASQDADAASGDAVGGSAIGIVDDGTGNVEVNASNSCTDCKLKTGNSNAHNASAFFVGQNSSGGGIGVNVQLGDNEADVSQGTSSATGDAVTGLVLGIV